MTNNFPFLKDLALGLKVPAGVSISDTQIREIAESLDVTLLFDNRCREYLRQLLEQLSIFFVKADDPALAPLSEDDTDDAVARLIATPFRSRTDAELRALSIQSLAVNPIAIDQMCERLAENPLTDEWLDIHDAEADRLARRDGIGWVDAYAIAAKLGVELDAGSRSLVGAERGDGGLDDDASSRPLVLRWHIAADDAQHIRWHKGSAQDSHAKHLDVQITAETADRLSLIVGGIGYIESGCRVTARWLDLDNKVNAEASAHDQDQPLVLDNSTKIHRKSLSPLDRVELKFETSSPTLLSFTAVIPLHEPRRPDR